MQTSEAAALIRAMSDSIKSQPAQFIIQVNVTGQRIEVRGGGTGMTVTAFGGAARSVTIGNNVSLDGASVDIARKRGQEVMSQEIRKLVETLDRIAVELESQKPNKTALEELYNSLKNNWIPGVITSVVGSAIASYIGIN